MSINKTSDEVTDNDLSLKSRASTVSDPLAKLKAENQKTKISAIWEQLKSGKSIQAPPKKNQHGVNPLDFNNKRKDVKTQIPSFLANLGLSKPKSQPVPESDSQTGSNDSSKKIKSEVASEAILAAKMALSTQTPSEIGKIKFTETKDFAGQKVEVTRVLDPNSKEAVAIKRKAESMSSASGLDSILSKLEKKKKINILDKSKKDWVEYKEEIGVVEELEVFKKSGETFTEKVAFLERAELREYEKERDERLSAQAKRRLG